MVTTATNSAAHAGSQPASAAAATTATAATAAPKRIVLPPKVRVGGHVPGLQLPAPYIVRQMLGCLVDVRDDKGNRYLLADGGDSWLLHRRITPTAKGHARNATEVGPPLAIAKTAVA